MARILRGFQAVVLLVVWISGVSVATAQAPGPQFKVADIGNGIRLNYVEQGIGPTVIFVHGSLSDYSYWKPQVAAFADHYHVIAYSRRYNYPNKNPSVAGYSAVTDSQDLAALIETLHLGKVDVIGHSYGALTALFLAARRPDLLNAVVLAEPPAVGLLRHLEDGHAAEGQRMYADIQARMVRPMTTAFKKGDSSGGVGVFIDYVFRKPGAWQRMSPSDRSEVMRDAAEWDVMMPQGTLFPEIGVDEVRGIHVPVLLMSGGQSYPFLNAIDEELTHLIPHSQRIIFSDAGHQMWLKHPDDARSYAEAFFTNHARGQ